MSSWSKARFTCVMAQALTELTVRLVVQLDDDRQLMAAFRPEDADRVVTQLVDGVTVPVLHAQCPLHRGLHSGQTWSGWVGSPGSALRPSTRRSGRNRMSHAASTLPRLSVPWWVSWSPVERTEPG